MADATFDAVCEALLGEPGVTESAMFGAPCLKVGGKVFCSSWKGALVVKVPAERVQELAALPGAAQFDPGMGRKMREWVELQPGRGHDWVALAREAHAFVAGGAGR